jgi:hypothetical protein
VEQVHDGSVRCHDLARFDVLRRNLFNLSTVICLVKKIKGFSLDFWKELCLKYIFKNSHFYSEFDIKKYITLRRLDHSHNKLQDCQIKASHSAVFERVELKLLCSQFNLEVGHLFYSEFAVQKLYLSGAFILILDNKRQECKIKGFHLATFERV